MVSDFRLIKPSRNRGQIKCTNPNPKTDKVNRTMSDNENEDSPMPFASATQQQTPTAQPVV